MTTEQCTLLSKVNAQQVFGQVSNVSSSSESVFTYSNFVVDTATNSNTACANTSSPFKCVVRGAECTPCQSLFIKISNSCDVMQVSVLMLVLGMIVLM